MTRIERLTNQPMLKFFRNIRYRLLGENRFTRYLFYAIGEIILVVIGILIAENLAPTLKGGFSKTITK